MKVPIVRIQIKGGVAEVVKKSKGVILEIYDHDNAACAEEGGRRYSAAMWIESEEV